MFNQLASSLLIFDSKAKTCYVYYLQQKSVLLGVKTCKFHFSVGACKIGANQIESFTLAELAYASQYLACGQKTVDDKPYVFG
jgi:hypothetical protein